MCLYTLFRTLSTHAASAKLPAFWIIHPTITLPLCRPEQGSSASAQLIRLGNSFYHQVVKLLNINRYNPLAHLAAKNYKAQAPQTLSRSPDYWWHTHLDSITSHRRSHYIRTHSSWEVYAQSNLTCPYQALLFIMLSCYYSGFDPTSGFLIIALLCPSMSCRGQR